MKSEASFDFSPRGHKSNQRSLVVAPLGTKIDEGSNRRVAFLAGRHDKASIDRRNPQPSKNIL